MTNQLITPSRALDRNGEPQPGAMAYVYLSGTTTAQVVTDAVGIPLTWPVVADIDGVFPQMFYAGAAVLKVVLTDSTAAVLPGGIIDPVAVLASTAATTALQAAIQGVADQSAATEATILTITSAIIKGGGLATGTGSLPSTVTINVPAADNADAVAGTSDTKVMTPATTKRAIKEWAWLQGYTSAPLTIISAGLHTLPHGLQTGAGTGRVPKGATMVLTCTAPEYGWSIGDAVSVGINSSTSGTSRANTVYFDTTNIYVRLSSDANCFAIGDKATGTVVALTNSKWTLTVGAF